MWVLPCQVAGSRLNSSKGGEPMPKLLHFFQNPSTCPGGTEKVMERINEVALEIGFECDEISEQLFRLHPLSRRYPMLNTPGNILQMSWQARRRLSQADVVVSHGVYAPWCKVRGHVHVLHSTHSGTAEAMRPHVPKLDYWVARHVWGGLFEGSAARRATCVAVSRFAAEEARRFYGKCPEIVPNAINARLAPAPSEASQRVRQELGLGAQQRLLLVVGRRERIKGWRVCLAMLDQLPANVSLVSVGQGEAPAHPRLLALPPRPAEELAVLYSAADWVLSPSLYEGFGLTILEAWACGTPVLATPTGLTHDLLGEEPAFDACVARRTDDAEALLQVLHRVLEREDYAARQVTWGQSLLAGRYSRETFQQNWRRLLTHTTTRSLK